MISRSLIIGIVLLTLSACVENETPDFCRDHALFHDEHVAGSATLDIVLGDDGQVVSELQIPMSGTNNGEVVAKLDDTSKVFTLETARPCAAANVQLQSERPGVGARYSLDCGADNKLEQVNVLLFSALPDLNEVEVTVTTPTTAKHFAIHRQCESAIFRLQ